jgi:CRISPR/Cas system CSM-associated protein Csm3 (group 7 of RAMP superfamily)
MSANKPRFIQRLIFTGTLRTLCPLHIGGLDLSVHTDMPLTRDVLGRIFLPGSSLAGMLRAACDAESITELFGFAEGDKGQASRVYVDDASVIGAPKITLTDHVRIDRHTGAAADRARFDLEALEADTCFNFRAVLEINPGSAPHQSELTRLLCQLSNGDLSLGRGTQRGYGEIKLEGLCIQRQDFTTIKGIIAALKQSTAADPAPQANSPSTALRIKVKFSQQGPLMVKASNEGMDIKMLPRTARKDGKAQLVIPGSSIKGAFRSHAERIMRTILDKSLATNGAPISDGSDQLDLPLVDVLFGLARSGGGKHAGNAPDKKPGTAGVLRFKTLYAENGASDEGWDALAANNISDKDAPLSPHYTELEKANLRGNRSKLKVDVAYHVAIDRWTGGAADNMLYTAVEPWHTQWPTLEISLDLILLEKRFKARDYKDPASAAQAAQILLLHVLSDFCQGDIALGFGTTRGYGSVCAEPGKVHFEGPIDNALAQDKTLEIALTPAGQAAKVLQSAWGNVAQHQLPHHELKPTVGQSI